MKKLFLVLAVLILAGGYAYAGFAGSGFSGPPFQHGTLTNTKMCIYTAGTGIVCNSDPSGSGTVTEVTGDTMIDVATGTTTPALSIQDNSITSAKLLDNTVAPGKIACSGTKDNTTFLRMDGTCATPAGTGDMTEEAYSTGGIIKNSKGGTGADSSSSTGFPYVLSGTWSFDNVATFLARLGLGATDNVTFAVVTADSYVTSGTTPDGERKLTLLANTSIAPTAAAYEQYVEGTVWKVNENGTEKNPWIFTNARGDGAVLTDNTVALSKLYTTGGTAGASTYLRGDNTWATPSGSGDMLAATYDANSDNVVDTAAALSAQYIDWNSGSGGASIANKPTIGTLAAQAAGTLTNGRYCTWATGGTIACDSTGTGGGGGTTELPWDNITSRPTINSVTVTGAVLDNVTNYPAGLLRTDGSAASLTSFPTLNQNTSGTAANLSGTPALPNGVTVTTQAANDNSAKPASTAYVDQRYEYERFAIPDTALSDNTIIAGPLDRAWTIDNIVVVIQDNTGKLSASANDNVTFNIQYGATSAFASPTNVYSSDQTPTGAADFSAALNNTAPLTGYYIRIVFSAANMTNKKFYIQIKYHRT